MRLMIFLLTLLFPFSTFAAQDVTIKGKDFFLDGKPWLPKGGNGRGFQSPGLHSLRAEMDE